MEHLKLLENSRLKIQLVPLYEYHQNLAERSIQIFKNYFIAGLSGTDQAFFTNSLKYLNTTRKYNH